MAVRNRALSLATAGVLAGSALALATDGFLQLDQVAALQAADSTHKQTAEQVALQGPELPVIETLPRAAAGGPIRIEYTDQWKAFRYDADIQLVLVAYSDWLFTEAQPVSLDVKSQRFAFGWHEADIGLRLWGEHDVRYRDQRRQDDEELIIALAIDYFYED